MKVRWLIWVPLAAFVAVFAVVAFGLIKPNDRVIHSAMVGKPVPAIALPALLPDRPGVTSADLATGKPRLLNVFASWCLPCIAEAPQLLALKESGIEIYAVAVRDKPDDVRNFLARYGDPYARIGDDRQSAAQLALGSSGVPETFVIDSKGRIVKQHIGDIRPEHIPELLQALRSAQ